jgi:hypothetical protein|tara:strand:+ start:318 stop:479 length:162 start_codon:yes stop_codon:yes gene_type:complete
MEDLKTDPSKPEEQWEFVTGPFKTGGNNEFVVIYKNSKSKKFKQRIYALPDSM